MQENNSATEELLIIPNPNGEPPFIGMQVYLPHLNNLQGEVIEIHNDIKNLITKVKVIHQDGRLEVLEVTDIVVTAVKIIEKIIKTNIFKIIGDWFKKIFSKKKKR